MTSDQHRITVKCPYCGNSNVFLRDHGNMWGLHAMYCTDGDAAGCDQVFAVEWKFVPLVKIHKCEAEKDDD